MHQPDIQNRKWWKEAVVYQVYTRSFKDSNGDGIGDIPGILSKLGYLKSLGIDLLWLSPIFASPNDDNGYDISDYEAIMKEFGTMEDFDALLKALHENGIRLLLDLAVNHTSDEHRWFAEARKSRDNPYRHYYHWWPAEKGKPTPRFSFFEADAWTYDEQTDAYYLHYFSKKQPDLNWENPEVRREIHKMMRYWFDKGVDGFRLDAIPYIAKDTDFPEISREELKKRYRGDWSYYYSRGSHLHDYLREMNREVLQHYDIATIAEAPGILRKDASLFVDTDRRELHMLYHFEGMQLGYAPGGFKRPDPEGYKLTDFKRVYTEWDAQFGEKGWGTVYLDNHDQPRMVTRWGNDAPGLREPSTKMLITFLLTMRATPIFFNGGELGMTNIKFDDINDYRDIETLSKYRTLKDQGGDVKRFLEDQKTGARDNSRTPFQWDASPTAGFTTGVPWIKVNPNHTFINKQAQEDDADSVLNYFRRMVQLRKERAVLTYGAYQLYDEKHPDVYTYTRSLGNETLLIVLNFSKELVRYTLPQALHIKKEPLINNGNCLQLEKQRLTLLPYQALIFEAGKK